LNSLTLQPRGGWRWLWAAPWSLLGLVLTAPALLVGARPRWVGRTLEVSGGRLSHWMAEHGPFGVVAITLGHVILGRDEATLQLLRAHERVHVRQYERWGPLFVPAYLANSAWHWLHGRHPYLDNGFERQARAGEDAASADAWSVTASLPLPLEMPQATQARPAPPAAHHTIAHCAPARSQSREQAG
jgi:hypothetical protein